MKQHSHSHPSPWAYPLAFAFAVIFLLITGSRMLAWLLLKFYELFTGGNL